MVASLDWTIGRKPDFARGRCRLGSCFLAGSPATTAVHHHSHTVEDFGHGEQRSALVGIRYLKWPT